MIDKLTPEQEAMIPQYVEKYTAIGLCTDRIDPDAAVKYAAKLYEFIQKPMPKVIVAKGPIDAWYLTNLYQLVTTKSIDPDNITDDVKVEAKSIADTSTIIWPYLDGQFWASYVAYVKFMQYIGMVIDTRIDIFEDQLQFGLVFTLDNFCIISDRMSECYRNANGLHRDGGPAVSYLDGTKIWCLNGVNVPQWLAENPVNKIDISEFAKIQNAEVRREFIRKIGVERICMELGSVVIDKKDEYELHEIDLGGTTGKWPYLKMLNPSIGTWHMECVDQSCRTVDDAIKWRNQSDLAPSVLT